MAHLHLISSLINQLSLVQASLSATAHQKSEAARLLEQKQREEGEDESKGGN